MGGAVAFSASEPPNAIDLLSQTPQNSCSDRFSHVNRALVIISATFNMDWARDDACLSNQEADLKRIFNYDPRPSVVVKIARSNEVGGHM
jgi:hypothetical protein